MCVCVCAVCVCVLCVCVCVLTGAVAVVWGEAVLCMLHIILIAFPAGVCWLVFTSRQSATHVYMKLRMCACACVRVSVRTGMAFFLCVGVVLADKVQHTCIWNYACVRVRVCVFLCGQDWVCVTAIIIEAMMCISWIIHGKMMRCDVEHLRVCVCASVSMSISCSRTRPCAILNHLLRFQQSRSEHGWLGNAPR